MDVTPPVPSLITDSMLLPKAPLAKMVFVVVKTPLPVLKP
jgi:hypothetical protein